MHAGVIMEMSLILVTPFGKYSEYNEDMNF